MKARLLLVAGLVGGSFLVSPAGGAQAAERVGALNATPADASFDLSWTKPADAPGQTGVPSGWEINGYVVRVFNSAFPAEGLVKICQHQTGDAQACTVTTDVDGSGSDDLANGVQYSVSVAARWKDPGADLGNTIDDEDVEGTESALVTVTPRTVPNAPGSPAAAYTDSSEFSDDEVPTITATVSWTTPDNGGATIDQYDALPVDVDGNLIGPDADSSTTSDNETGCTATGESTLQCDMSGLALNSTFYFDVSATNDAGASQTTRSARLVTPPGPPTITAVTNVAAGVQVTWTEPDGTAPVTEYTVEALDSAGAVASTTTWTSGTLRSTFTDLTEGEGYTFQVTGQNTSTYDGNALGTGYGVAGTWDQTVTVTSSGGFEALEKPVRIMDTRDGDMVGSLDVAGDSDPYVLQVAGVAGVPESAVAVAMNVTAVGTLANDYGGYVTVYPCGGELPDVSNLNFVSGQTVPNNVIVPLSADGTVCFYVYGKAHLLADVSGYFESGFDPLEKPVRIMDTRDGDMVGSLDVAGDSDPYVLQVAGVAGVPESAVAVAMNVTSVGTLANDYGGYVTVYPCGGELPDVSNLNFVSGQTVPNNVIVPLSADGTVCFYVYGKAHLLADVSGYFESGFDPLEKPVRIMDTRDGDMVGSLDVAGDSDPYVLQVAGVAGVPESAVAVAMNVTAVGTLANDYGGYVTVYPCGGELPDVSNLNFVSGQTVPNNVIVPLSADGTVCFYVYGKAHLLADVSGYFGS